ncbi:cardiolipin synthase (CMP-forming) [Stegastes partitus]|uniref:Cardiolipin synthase (CMP-forming) n=1 Tax=Stegastes partitus TaxID=144197 RepID=A0A9Y4NFA9_9TELE|nr:PREDICTED: cardiolipin synthase [Stegastes partitus]
MMTTCFQRISAPLRRSAPSVRRAAVCGLEPASWRLAHTPVPERARCTQPPVSGSCLLRLRWTDGRVSCWSGILQQVNRTHGCALQYRGGHERSAAATSFRCVLTPGARGLCSSSKKSEETPESGPVEQRGDTGAVPGQGLFKFKELYENPWTIPNLLCVCRILLAPFLGHLIIQQHFHLSLALFTLAGATDLVRHTCSLTLTHLLSQPSFCVSAPLTALVIFRDIGLIAAVFWVRYKTVPPPVTLSKFFNPCYTTAQLKPTLFSKVNTAIQLFLVAASLAAPVFQYTDSVLLQCLWYVTAVTTAASGYSYWHYGRKTVEVLNKTP